MKKILKKSLIVLISLVMVFTSLVSTTQDVSAKRKGNTITRVHKTRHKGNGKSKKASHPKKKKARKKVTRKASKRHKKSSSRKKSAHRRKAPKRRKSAHKKKIHRKSSKKKSSRHKKHKSLKKKAHRRKSLKRHKKKSSHRRKAPKKIKLTKASLMAFIPAVALNTGTGASISAISSLLATALLAVATVAVIFAAIALIVYAAHVYLNSRPITNKEADNQANKLGYGRTGGLSHGKPVYKSRGKAKPKFISPDQDRHNGGYWKGSDSEKKLKTRPSRQGTYDKNLKKKGK